MTKKRHITFPIKTYKTANDPGCMPTVAAEMLEQIKIKKSLVEDELGIAQ